MAERWGCKHFWAYDASEILQQIASALKPLEEEGISYLVPRPIIVEYDGDLGEWTASLYYRDEVAEYFETKEE